MQAEHDLLEKVLVHNMEICKGRFPQCRPPMILGHEGGGIVEAVGEDVRSVRGGDRVIVECILYCGRCKYCRRRLVGICDSSGVIGITGPQGEYAEYFVVPEKNCHMNSMLFGGRLLRFRNSKP